MLLYRLFTPLIMVITFLIERTVQGKPTKLTLATKCKPDSVDSPINIKSPMSYVNFQVDFKLVTLHKAEMIKVAKNHLKIQGEFGKIYYQNIEYRIYDVHFKYPSEHRINGIRYAMEMQISSVSLNGAQFMVDVLFERNDYMGLHSISNYGFDNKFVRKMPILKDDPVKCRFNLHGSLTMEDFLKNRKDFYLYEGSNINGDCKTALHLIVAEPLWINSDQLSIFEEAQEPVYKTKRYSNAVVYQNFVKQTDYALHNVTSSRRDLPNGPVPGPYSHLPFLYQPQDGKPLGFLNKEFLPIWGGVPGGVHIVEPEFPPARHGHVKFVKIGYRPFKMPGLERPFYLSQYLLVNKYYQLPKRSPPASIPVYMRAKYLTKGKFAPIVKIRMPLIFEGKKRNDENEDSSAPSIACKKWWLQVTLNRNFKHELQYKNITDSINKMSGVRKCANYFLLPSHKNSLNDLGSKDFGTNNVTINNTGAGEFGGICKTHLHVLLNRESDENLGDYVYHGCYQQKKGGFLTGKHLNMGKLSGFAQAQHINKKETRAQREARLQDEIQRRLEDRSNQLLVLENRDLPFLEGQKVMKPHQSTQNILSHPKNAIKVKQTPYSQINMLKQSEFVGQKIHKKNQNNNIIANRNSLFDLVWT